LLVRGYSPPPSDNSVFAQETPLPPFQDYASFPPPPQNGDFAPASIVSPVPDLPFDEFVDIPGTPPSLPTQNARSDSIACPSCPKTFPRACDLNHHIKATHQPTFICPNCTTKPFGLKKDLDRHIKTLHPETVPGFHRFYCPVETCKHAVGKGKGWPRADNYRRHVRTKHPEIRL